MAPYKSARRGQEFFQQGYGFRLAIVLQVNFGELQEQRPGFAHHPLLYVQVGKFFERANFLRRELGDAFINRDGLGEKTVADKNLREAFEIIYSLESFSLANIEFANGHQGDLIARFEFQDLLVFGDSLRDFALVQKFLGGFDEFAFVISHALTGTVRVHERGRRFRRTDSGTLSETFSSMR